MREAAFIASRHPTSRPASRPASRVPTSRTSSPVLDATFALTQERLSRQSSLNPTPIDSPLQRNSRPPSPEPTAPPPIPPRNPSRSTSGQNSHHATRSPSPSTMTTPAPFDTAKLLSALQPREYDGKEAADARWFTAAARVYYTTATRAGVPSELSWMVILSWLTDTAAQWAGPYMI